jgi:REP element-mobilizing transposase RayT
MPRGRRAWVHEDHGSYHVISRVADREAWFTDAEKEHFLRLLERLARGFFVQLHAFCIMSNHFHLLVTATEAAAAAAPVAELRRRYRAIFGPLAQPPAGALDSDGTVIPDPDGGTSRLRARLGSVSRFVQELKQAFSRWYNRQHGRKGYLWGDRWKGVLVAKHGDAEVVTAAYIDLNPVRAKVTALPEDYRWSSLGLLARAPGRARRLLTALARPELRRHGTAWYRQFVYVAGAVAAAGKPGRLPEAVRDAVVARAGQLGVLARLRYRCRNLSEGLALGTAEFVAKLQTAARRAFVRPRRVLEPAATESAPVEARAGPVLPLCATRVLRGAPA